MPVIPPQNYTLAALRRQREQPENLLTAGIGGVLAEMGRKVRRWRYGRPADTPQIS